MSSIRFIDLLNTEGKISTAIAALAVLAVHVAYIYSLELSNTIEEYQTKASLKPRLLQEFPRKNPTTVLRQLSFGRHPLSYSLKHLKRPLSGDFSENIFSRSRKNESFQQWLKRINDHVYQTTSHCAVIQEFAGLIDYSPTAAGGIIPSGIISCGFCDQRANWLRLILRQNGVHGRLLSLGGHVVFAVADEQTDRHWILDPDYGTGPFIVDIGSADELREAAKFNYGFLVEHGYRDVFRKIVHAFETTTDNAFLDGYDDLILHQSMWIHKLAPLIESQIADASHFSHSILHNSNRATVAERISAVTHGLLVAAEIKYGVLGYTSINIDLEPEDFIAYSILSHGPSTRKILEVSNWGFQPFRFDVVQVRSQACSLQANRDGEYTAPPQMDIRIVIDSRCPDMNIKPQSIARRMGAS